MKKHNFYFNIVSKREILQKSLAVSGTVFGIVTVFSNKIFVILLACAFTFLVASFMEYRTQKNAGIINEVVDKSITGINTQFVLKKAYGIYNTDHYVYIYFIDGIKRSLFAVGKLYEDPVYGRIAPLYLIPICFFDSNKKQIKLSEEEISNIDYKKLYVSRWMIADDN